MLTVAITTFKHRFEGYFKSLVNDIRRISNDIEIVVLVNGEHGESFDEEYRKNLLKFLSGYNKVYPIFFPQFRGLSKLWNTGLIHSSNDYVLMLNDDVSIVNENTFPTIIENIKNLQTSFQINNSFSHVVLKKNEIIYDLGGFSEKLLGIGEEEYLMWRYVEAYGKEMPNVNINGFVNHVDFSHSPTNIKQIEGGSKYSQFNREMMYKILFNIDNENGKRHGKIPANLIINLGQHPHQYPNESFYNENKHNL